MSPTITCNIGQICRKYGSVLPLSNPTQSRALLLDTFTQHPFHMAVIEMRLTTLLLLLLVSFLSFHRYFSKRHTGSVIIVDNYFGLS